MKPSDDWFCELPARAQHGVAGQRLDRLLAIADARWPAAISASSRAVTAVSAPTENPPTRPVSLPAPMIVAASGCFEYSSSASVGRALRRAADAARIEQARAVAVVAVHVEAERAGALDEERPPLGEERLEGIEIDDGRIGFDLAEVRIRRRGQREARRHRVLQVEADRAAGIGRIRSADRRRRPARVSTLPSEYGISSKRFGAPRHLAGRAVHRTARRSRWRCATAAATTTSRRGGRPRE